MTAKDYLLRYRTLPDRVAELVTEMHLLFEQKECIVGKYPCNVITDMPRGSDVGDPTFNKIVLLDKINRRLDYIGKQYEDIDNELYSIEKTLESLTETERSIIEYRYVFHHRLYCGEIMDKLDIRKEKYYRLHDSALKKIEEIIQSKTA
jgi:hypothetical protein